MDMSVLWDMHYGLYALGTLDGDRKAGNVVNTVFQITAENPILAVSLNNNSHTLACLKKNGKLTISVLAEDVWPQLIGKLGFFSGRDKDKFADIPHHTTASGLPYIYEGATGYIETEVISFTEVETHTLALVRVIDAAKCGSKVPMTYAYYHKVLKGKAPKEAPTSGANAAVEAKGESWVCTVCKYVHNGDLTTEPADYKCPVCGVGKDKFAKQ